MADSDYGSTITKGGVTVGRCIIVDFPELATDKINTTNHASGGWSEGIPSGLINAGDITLMVLIEGALVSTVIAEMLAKTVSEVVITNEADTFTFDGFYLSMKPESADAQSPNALRASVVITPTGEISIS
jgi:hypothetical protein